MPAAVRISRLVRKQHRQGPETKRGQLFVVLTTQQAAPDSLRNMARTRYIYRPELKLILTAQVFLSRAEHISCRNCSDT